MTSCSSHRHDFDVVEVDELTTGFLCDDDTVIVYVLSVQFSVWNSLSQSQTGYKSTIKMRNRGKVCAFFCLLFYLQPIARLLAIS